MKSHNKPKWRFPFDLMNLDISYYASRLDKMLFLKCDVSNRLNVAKQKNSAKVSLGGSVPIIKKRLKQAKGKDQADHA